MVSIYHFSLKSTKFSWEIPNFKSRAEVYELNLGHLVSEIKGGIKDKWDQVTSQPEGVSTELRWDEPKINKTAMDWKT